MSNTHVASAKKIKRNHLTLKVKLDVIKRAESGERAVDIAKYLTIPPTSVRTIIKDKEKYKKYVVDAVPIESKAIKSRSTIMVKMEKLLLIWIEDQTQRSMPLSQMLIQEKALHLYNDLKKVQGITCEGETFNSSRGWFDRFKKRSGIHNVKLVGEARAVLTKGR